MKGICVLFSVILFVPALAGAQGANGVLDSFTIEFSSPEMAACYARCVAGQCADPTAVAPDCSESRVKKAKKVKRKGATLASKLAQLRKRVKKLEGQVGALGSSGDPSSELGKLQKELQELRKLYKLLLKDIVDLGAKDYALQLEIEALKDRLTAIERKDSVVKLRPRGGFVLLAGFDGPTTYTGFSTGPELTLTLSDTVYLSLQTNVLLSFSSNPIGTQLRGVVGVDLHPNWSVEAGVQSAWVGYNDRLLAKSAFLSAEFAAVWRPVRFFNIGLGLLVGAEFDQDQPAFALGGQLSAGIDW
ncbi:hypothetical protein AMJ57_01755 [Parcubacteria bacterium SG8_24]|nr:MAG: hypothetical protein AMJ57_01755 [Parcubacteria bacterium SG8_24]